MYHFLFFLFWGSLSLAGLAILLTLFVPKYRKQLKIQSTRTTLEERYAKEIAAGTAVIIPKDPTEFKKLILMFGCAAIFVVLFQWFKNYTSSLMQTCATIGEWNSSFVFLGVIFFIGGILLLFITLFSYKYYKEIMEDGYAPSRKNKDIHDRISFKLTKWRRLKEQFRLITSIAFCILFISSPILLLQANLNTPIYKFNYIHILNDHLQQACLANLKKKP